MPAGFNVDELARIGGVRAIPVLLDALERGAAYGSHKTIYALLSALLPQLKASDAGLLTARHRRLLNNALRVETWPGAGRIHGKGFSVEFVLAILKAYEQVGDATAVPFVETLADTRARVARRQRIQEAAQACLPLLQATINAISHAQTLLRASGRMDTAPDMLLRSASDTAATSDPDLLLRATHTADTPTP